MKVLKILSEVLKTAFSGFANNIMKIGSNIPKHVIKNNQNAEIKDNTIKNASVQIKNNKDLVMKGNKWE